MHLILLSGENIKLARHEAQRLLHLSATSLKDNMLMCTIPSDKMDIVGRLAYTRKIYEILYTTTKKNLEASLESYPWMNIYEKSFCIRITSKEHYDERYYAGFVWKRLEKETRPKVDLNNPGLFIEIFIDGQAAIVTRLLYQNFETFEDRKAHLRPVLHPTAMHPKMARALINIVDPAKDDKLVDPFCGACGILTEAGLLGIRFEGSDIDRKILDDAKKNMEYLGIDPKLYSLYIKDATKTKNQKNVVTDLPYGKSSKKSHELVELYSLFLKNLGGKAVIVMPDFMPYKQLLAKYLPKKLQVTDIVDHYVHKSLTRKIIIIDLCKKSSGTVKKNNKKTNNTKIANAKKRKINHKPKVQKSKSSKEKKIRKKHAKK